jgi:cytochrome c biogenesis protein CcdA
MGGDIMDSLIILLGILAIYFASVINAMLRDHRNTGAIGTLNFFLGWTLIGWVMALTWSMTDHVRPTAVSKSRIGAAKAASFWGVSFYDRPVPPKSVERKVESPDYRPGQEW